MITIELVGGPRCGEVLTIGTLRPILMPDRVPEPTPAGVIPPYAFGLMEGPGVVYEPSGAPRVGSVRYRYRFAGRMTGMTPATAS